ncbi:MAG: pyruvate kinase [Candidatus Thiodiazotropha sp.]
MPRRTKIVATLGPATDGIEVTDRLIAAGVDVVRINLSHDSLQRHRERTRLIRQRAAEAGREIAVLIDLQGPKIRIGTFKDGKVELKAGDRFAIDANCDLSSGDQQRVGTTYAALADDLSENDTLILDDGAIELLVTRVESGCVHCQVVVGGTLSNNKGINKRGGGLSAPALTAKDREDIKFAAEIDADYLGVSFVRNAEDVESARSLLREAGCDGGIVSKIERVEALQAIDGIINASDAIMVARGDLGVEIGDAKLPEVQKQLIHKARSNNCVVITATQMMQSMIESPIPTRAEVFDVSNAVIDGTDAVMLSAESSIGRNPPKVVAALDRICMEAEKNARRSKHRIDSHFGRVDEAIAMASMYIANHLEVKAIAALTETGSTAKWMSRMNSGIPIHALTRSQVTCRKVTLYRGVYPLYFDVTSRDLSKINSEVIEAMLSQGTVQEGDLVLITKGDRSGVEGQTNIMKIMRVGEHTLSRIA